MHINETCYKTGRVSTRDFTVLKGNYCILRIGGAPVHQKLGVIIENKVAKKFKLEKKDFFTKMVS